jgi:hypothetical protein
MKKTLNKQLPDLNRDNSNTIAIENDKIINNFIFMIYWQKQNFKICPLLVTFSKMTRLLNPGYLYHGH